MNEPRTFTETFGEFFSKVSRELIATYKFCDPLPYLRDRPYLIDLIHTEYHRRCREGTLRFWLEQEIETAGLIHRHHNG